MADEALELLELLECEAPSSALDEVVRRAKDAGASGTELRRLTRARDLSLTISNQFTRRKQREAGLVTLVDTARDLALPNDLDTLLSVVTRRARLLLGLDMSWVTFADPEAGILRVRAADGHASASTLGRAMPIQGGLGGPTVEGNAPFWSADYLNDPSFTRTPVLDEIVRAEGLHAVIAVQLRRGATLLGVLYAADRLVRRFTPDEVSQLNALADLAASTLERARLLERAQHRIAELESGGRTADAEAAAHASTRSHSGRLLDLVLQDGCVSTVAAEAAKALPGTLLVRDIDGRDLVCLGEESPVYDEAEIRTVLLEAHIGRQPMITERGLWVASVAAGDEMLGTLVFAPQTPIDDDQVELLALTAQITAVVLLMEHGMTAAKGQLRDDFFSKLLRGPSASPHQLTEHGRRFAVDLDEPHVVVIARPAQGVKCRAMAWAASYAQRHHGLKSVEGEVIGLLLPGTDPTAAARQVSQELSEVLGCPVTTGSAGPAESPGAIAHTYQEAERCLDAVTVLSGSGSTASLQQLGFLGLLLSGRPDVSWFIDSTIGPVLDYDEQQSTELIRTLEAYFASATSPSRAAEALYVHPNTVSRRLERISELLGGDWQKPARALQVQLALQLQRTRQALSGDRARRSPRSAESVPGPRETDST